MTRLIAITALTALLAACNGADNDGVRDTPQAVHPSPSKLAQGTTCGSEGQPACYTPVADDGSRPIID